MSRRAWIGLTVASVCLLIMVSWGIATRDPVLLLPPVIVLVFYAAILVYLLRSRRNR